MTSSGDLRQVSVDAIHVVWNVRRRFDDTELAKLTESIRQVGVLQPLVVNANPDTRRFELVCGERRLRAARAAGLAEVPAIVRTMTTEEVAEAQMTENLQRADLNPIEEAFGFRRAIEDLGYTQERLAERLGVSAPHVSNRLRLLRLPPGIQDEISRENLHAGHGLALLRLVPDGADTPSPLFKEVAEAMLKERPPVADAAEFVWRRVHREGKSLRLAKESWEGSYYAKFDYREQCGKCPFLLQMKGQDPLCANPPCYKKKQAAAAPAWDSRIKEQQAKAREKQIAEQRKAAEREKERRAKDAVRRAAGAVGDLEVPTPEPAQTAKRIDTKAPPAGPPGDYDAAEVLRLRTVGRRAWKQARERIHMATAAWERECLVTLGELLAFFVRRQEIGATQIPVQFGHGVVHIPEQGVTFVGEDGREIAGVGIDAGHLVVARGAGYQGVAGVVYDVPPRLGQARFYYRIGMGEQGGTKALVQQVVIPGTGRHLVLTASDSMTIRKELLPKLQALANQLPAFPVELAAAGAAD